MTYKANSKIAIVGGHDSWRRELQKSLSGKVKYIESKDRTFDAKSLRNFDCIYLQTNYLGHVQFRRVQNVAKKYNVEVRYFKNAGVSACISQLAEDELKASAV